MLQNAICRRIQKKAKYCEHCMTTANLFKIPKEFVYC
jgi:hypothetical protein